VPRERAEAHGAEGPRHSPERRLGAKFDATPLAVASGSVILLARRGDSVLDFLGAAENLAFVVALGMMTAVGLVEAIGLGSRSILTVAFARADGIPTVLAGRFVQRREQDRSSRANLFRPIVGVRRPHFVSGTRPMREAVLRGLDAPGVRAGN